MEESHATTTSNWVKDILFLDTMLTPRIITFVYWIMLLIIIIGGIVRIFITGSLLSIFGILVGIVFARIWCEISVIFFRMNEALQEIRKK